MFNTIIKLGKRAQNYYTHLGRSRVREILLRYDDRLLNDAGFSRSMLEEGVQSWPWREDWADPSTSSAIAASSDQLVTRSNETSSIADEQAVALKQEKSPSSEIAKAKTHRQAIAELRTYSDKELRDVGVTRGTIEEAVRHGRADIDLPATSGRRDAA